MRMVKTFVFCVVCVSVYGCSTNVYSVMISLYLTIIVAFRIYLLLYVIFKKK